MEILLSTRSLTDSRMITFTSSTTGPFMSIIFREGSDREVPLTCDTLQPLYSYYFNQGVHHRQQIEIFGCRQQDGVHVFILLGTTTPLLFPHKCFQVYTSHSSKNTVTSRSFFKNDRVNLTGSLNILTPFFPHLFHL